MKEMVGGCCVCSDERGWDENPLVYCDGQGCTVAVHQACYGIVTVPSGPWFCRKCESQERAARVRCELCPSRDGALKRTDSNGWAHVVCALYIPEVRFGNVTTMEPILISLIPTERFNKSCYICEESSRGSKAAAGACMQCNKPGCKQNFHVTCAQMLGLLCEEAGNMMDNVKYCGYCQHHYAKLKKTSNMKIIPPFRPIPNSPHQGNNGSEACPVVVLNKEQISPDINNKSSAMKKKLSGSSSSSSSSKNSINMQSTTSSTAPRIAPSNLFSTNAFSNSLAKSSSERNDSSSSNSELSLHKSVEDSFVLKSEDLKLNSSTSCNGDSKKFLKANDFMTVKLNDVLTASLDRPIHETSHRDKSQPPDIKPHVTLTPIPMRSSDKLTHEKTSLLFGGPTSTPIPKLKDSNQISTTLDAEKSCPVISPILEKYGDSKHSLASSKRSRHSGDFDSSSTTDAPVLQQQQQHNPDSNRSTNADRGVPPSNWDNNKTSRQDSIIASANSDDRTATITPSNNPGTTEDLNRSPNDASVNQHPSQLPFKRGPGRPVKRKAVPGREEERIEELNLRKKSKRGGRRGGNSGSYNHRDELSELSLSASLIDENATDNSKKAPPSSSGGGGGGGSGGGGGGGGGSSSSSSRKPSSNPVPKKTEEERAPTLSQLKAQMEASKQQSSENSSSSILPAHMFGNALNPASSMAQRMVDTLSQEMETIAAAGVGLGDKVEKHKDKLIGIPVPKYSLTSSQTPLPNPNNGTNNIVNSNSTPSSGAATIPPQTLEQLLERQWEQGSQFLMEQAQHLDIAQLLSCLNQLKQDNRALEEHVASLLQRKEQLTAINARLSIPLGNSLSMNGPTGGVGNLPGDRDREGPPTQQPQQQQQPRPNNQAPTEVINLPQQGGGNSRPINYTGLPVPVVVTPHPSPHLQQQQQQGHGNR